MEERENIKRKKFSICIPIYKNEKNLPVTIPYIIEHLPLFSNYDVELVMVNDGSPDQSYELMQKYQKKYPDLIKIATLTRNFGQGACINCCMSIATGDVIGIISADMQEPFELFADMLIEWERGYKLVIATREDREDKGISVIGSKLFHKIMHRFVNARYPKGGFDFYLMDKEVADEYLKIDIIASSAQLKLLWLGYEYKEIKYIRKEREEGVSSWTFGGKLNSAIHALIAFSETPIHVILGVGIVLFGVSVLGLIIFIILKVFTGRSIIIAPILVFLSFMNMGITLSGLGVLGEYLWIILDMEKRFPRYVKDKERK